ncbi:MAG TPA: FAD-binding oxidoreductase [Candidatus Limnocylindrales bacterium]|nr:FAD-binding oxidoreductase [Candidatus Limnocylindrales bacterium]
MVAEPRAPSIEPELLEALKTSLSGGVLRPGDEGYEEARLIHNLAFDRHPALIVRAANDEDVVQTVNFARDNRIELAIRSGGHSFAGHSAIEGGILLDLAGLDQIVIDAEQRVGHAGAGVTAAAYTVAAFEHGVATPFGDTGSVGLAGLTLGGGIGWLVRKRGLTIDHLVSVDLVTADGQRLTASDDENPDLFWALRGGGGNFGVATRFTYRLEPIGTVLGGMAVQPLTRQVLRAVIDIAMEAPEELTVILGAMRMPPMPMVPEQMHFAPVAMTALVWDGDPDKGSAVVDRIRAAGTPYMDMIEPMPYPAIYQLMAEAEAPAPLAVRSAYVSEVSDTALDELVAFIDRAPVGSLFQLRNLGGAASRVPAEATAFTGRHWPALVALGTMFEDPTTFAEWDAFTEAAIERVAPGPRQAYVNFLANEGEEAVERAYGPQTWQRLLEIKRRYDPDNLFNRNQNIRP